MSNQSTAAMRRAYECIAVEVAAAVSAICNEIHLDDPNPRDLFTRPPISSDGGLMYTLYANSDYDSEKQSHYEIACAIQHELDRRARARRSLTPVGVCLDVSIGRGSYGTLSLKISVKRVTP